MAEHLTWDVVERETGDIVATFEEVLSRSTAVDRARELGFTRERYSVRARLTAQAYKYERKKRDYAAQARNRRRRNP